LSKIKNVAESKRLERLCPLGNTCLANRTGGLLPMLSEQDLPITSG